MRIEAKGNRAIVRFDKSGEREQHIQELVSWCRRNGMNPIPLVNGVTVGFSSADDAERELIELKKWCKKRKSEDIKKLAVTRADKFKRDTLATPIIQLDQRTPFEMWNLWYKILLEKFPAIVKPKRILKKELGMLRTLLDYYDHNMVEKIFQTAVHGWTVMVLKHRGISEIPSIGMVLKFKEELQSAASGGGLTSNTQRVPQGPDADKAYDDYKT